MEKRKIIFYDGGCPFCNKTVQQVLKHNNNQNIYFSALQSEFSREFFGEYEINLSTFYFYDDFQLYSKSKAAIQLSKYLSFPYSLMKVSVIIPVCFRDKVYDFIAKRRTKFSKDFCMTPFNEEKQRFLA